jgi:hypothetical protein
MMDFTFRNKRVLGPGAGGIHGIVNRYVEILDHGDLHAGHVEQFEGLQSGLRARLKAFAARGCKPPGNGGAAALDMMQWAATTPVPTAAEIQRYRFLKAISGGAAPTVSLIGGHMTMTVSQTSAFVMAG